MAGLLSRAWGVVDPFVPDEQVMGLLGRVMGRSQPLNQPITPGIQQSLGLPVTEPVPAQAGQMQNDGPGLGRYLQGILGGALPFQTRQAYEQEQRLASLPQRVASMDLPPELRALIETSPKLGAAALAKYAEPYTLSGGQVRGVGGDAVLGAPKVEQFDDRFGAYDPVTNKATFSEARTPTFDETTKRMDVTGAGGFTLAPGAKRFGPDGKLIASAPVYREVGADESLYEVGGETPPAAAGDFSSDNLAAFVRSVIPDAPISSRYRSPADNARVGGVENSYHTTDQAIDVPSANPQQTAALLRSKAPPGLEVIAESDHVHLEPAPGVVRGRGGDGGARVVAQGAPKRQGHIASPEEKAALGITGNAPVWIGADGKPDIVGGVAGAKITEGQREAAAFTYRTLQANNRMNNLAERGIYKPKTATAQLFDRDKNGAVRLVTKSNEDRLFFQAAKEWLAPILRRDTGAAVTDEELATYMDIYIGRYEDSPEVLFQKAQARDTAMRALYNQGRASYDEDYGAPGRWKVLTAPQGQQANGPPGEAVKMLRSNPKLATYFDAKYGKGASKRYLGGG